MNVEFFDSWDDAVAAMRAAEEAAVARTTPDQWNFTYGDHWLRAVRYGDDTLIIFGRVHTLAEQEAALTGCDQREAEAERELSASTYARGYRFGIAHSIACPEGELGDTHVSTMHKITREAFEQARDRGWDFHRCLEDRLEWALALLPDRHRHASPVADPESGPAPSVVCAMCHDELRPDQGAWVDAAGDGVCGVASALAGERRPHHPLRRYRVPVEVVVFAEAADEAETRVSEWCHAHIARLDRRGEWVVTPGTAEDDAGDG